MSSLLSFLSAIADEIVLKEGKTVRGTITKEDDKEVEIFVSGNMVLRIARDKIKEVLRPKKEGVKKIQVQTVPGSPPAPTINPTEAIPPTGPPPVAPIQPQLFSFDGKPVNLSDQKGNARLFFTVRRRTYPVRGLNLKEVSKEISDLESGKGFRVGYKRDPSKTVLVSSWEGRAMAAEGRMRWEDFILQATMTVSLPQWVTVKTPSAEAIDEWNTFAFQIERHDQGHVEIYENALKSLADLMGQLTAPDEMTLRLESEKLYQEGRQRMEKQQQGYDRRQKSKPSSPLSIPPQKT
ncbi:MAG: DUF922 domain-containing Zn-dependent protease [Elusimicrobia bacterium]|nr:DUF922 domain-containing Zn-dependent protease [Candidatus Obscuribacterium magneticum]